jgi:hypothetical protein
MQERVVGAFKSVIGFIVQGMNFEADGWRAFEGEMRELIAPHLPRLAHRRAKLLDGSDGRRWSDELEDFMESGLWPLLGDARAYADRNRAFVHLMLDIAIAEEQRRARALCAQSLPLVRAFDASWAG